MAERLGKDEILKRLLEEATVRWGRDRVEEMRPAFDVAVEAVWKVGEFRLETEEEPAHPGTIRERRGRE